MQSTESKPHTHRFVQGLGLFSTTAIVAGSMIGSGIFIVSADIARDVRSPALLIAAWLVTAVMTIIGALSYGELAAMMPKAGGGYVYLREAFGPLAGFLYGWTVFLVIQTGTIAAVGVAFGKYLGVFFPQIAASHWIWHMGRVPAWHVGPMVLGDMEIGLSTQNLVAMAIAILLTAINTFGVRLGALVQNIFTTAKVVSLLGVIALGILFGRNALAMAANFHGNFFAGAGWHVLHPVQVGTSGATVFVGLLTILGVAQVGSLFSAGSWGDVTFASGEVRNPQRTLPLALAMGAGGVLALYLLVNIVYLMALPLHGDSAGATVAARGIQFAAEDRVATAVMEQIFSGMGAKLMAAAILVSTFGCVNGILLSGARLYYAMSHDGLFFAKAGVLGKTSRVPVISLWMQCAWTCLLCLSGSYSQLLDYVIFADLVFYILIIAGLFVLRGKRPDILRPYRAVGYPWMPALYIVMASWVCVVLLRYKPQYTWPGLGIVLLGVPVYFVWAKRARVNI